MKAKEKFEQLKTAKNLNDQVLLAFYDTLPSVSIGEALGRWKGGDFQTGHWCNGFVE